MKWIAGAVTVVAAVLAFLVGLSIDTHGTAQTDDSGNVYPHVHAYCVGADRVYVSEQSMQGAGGDVFVVAGGCK